MTAFKEIAQSTLDDIFSFVESDYENYEVDYEDENLKIESLDLPKEIMKRLSQSPGAQSVKKSCVRVQ